MYDAPAPDGAQGDNGQDGGQGEGAASEQKSSAPQNNQATQLQIQSRQTSQAQEGQEDDLVQSPRGDKGEMDSGDILAYSGEISGQTAAPDLLEEKDGSDGGSQAPATQPEKPKQGAPSPQKQPAAPAGAKPEPKEAPAAPQPKAEPSEVQKQKEKDIQSNKEHQLQTQRDMQEAQKNLQKEDDEISRLQKLESTESAEEEQNKMIA